MLKSMGERTPPCGTPDLNCRFVDVWFLNVWHASLDVVFDVSEYDMWYVRVCEFICYCVYVYCVKCFAHVQCYCDSACGWNGLVETCCDSVVDVV